MNLLTPMACLSDFLTRRSGDGLASKRHQTGIFSMAPIIVLQPVGGRAPVSAGQPAVDRDMRISTRAVERRCGSCSMSDSRLLAATLHAKVIAVRRPKGTPAS